MAWLLLALAILLEVAGTTSMKFSNGFERLLPSVLMFLFYLLSFVALTYALKRIEVSVAYALWSGIGTLMITLLGAFLFKEPLGWVKVVSILFIVAGAVGLRLSSGTGGE
jgi:small multidrug resistance pump